MPKADYFDNAAGRLYSILTELRGRPGGEKIVDSWATVLKVKPPRGPDVFREIAAVMILPERIREQLHRLAPDDAEDMLEHLPPIDAALQFSFYLENPLQELLAKFSEADLVGLWYCSRELHRIGPEPVLSDEQQRALTEQLSVLLEEVQTSDLPADLKLFALRHLSAIMRALAEFRIRGMDGLREALVVAGAAFMSDKRFHEATDRLGYGNGS